MHISVLFFVMPTRILITLWKKFSKKTQLKTVKLLYSSIAGTIPVITEFKVPSEISVSFSCTSTL